MIARKPRTSRKVRRRPEQDQQQALMRWVFLNERRVPVLKFLLHCPNGGRRNPREAAIFKSMGVRAGVPDLLLPVPRGDRIGLAIEMKAPKGGSATEAQAFWMTGLQSLGWRVHLCRDWLEARDIICDYLGVSP